MNSNQFILQVIKRALYLFPAEQGAGSSFAKYKREGWEIDSNWSPSHYTGELEKFECVLSSGDISPKLKEKTRYVRVGVTKYPLIDESILCVTSISGTRLRKGLTLHFKFKGDVLAVSVYSILDFYRVRGSAGNSLPVGGISREITKEQIQFVEKALPNFLITK